MYKSVDAFVDATNTKLYKVWYTKSVYRKSNVKLKKRWKKESVLILPPKI